MLAIANLFTQLSILLRTSIPIAQCLALLAQTQNKIDLKQVLQQILADIHSGKSLFNCLSKHPNYFSPMICQLIKIGEHTGKLDEILIMISSHLDKQIAFNKRLKQALFYPCFILCCAGLIISLIFIFIIPRFAELFVGFNTPLPWLTRCILSISLFVQQQAPLLLFMASLLSIYIALHRQKRNLLFHYLQLLVDQLPFIHHYQIKIGLIRFSHQFALLFSAGIPVDQALRLTASVNSHQLTSKLILIAADRIQTGHSITLATAELSAHSPLLRQFIRIGEESGQLDILLKRFAEIGEAEVDAFLSRATQLLEPLIMLCLGVLIGGIVLSLYWPLINMGNVL